MKRLKRGTTSPATCCHIWISTTEDGAQLMLRFMDSRSSWARDPDQMAGRIKSLKSLYGRYDKWVTSKSGSGEGEEAAQERGFSAFEDSKFAELMSYIFNPAARAYGRSSTEVSMCESARCAPWHQPTGPPPPPNPPRPTPLFLQPHGVASREEDEEYDGGNRGFSRGLAPSAGELKSMVYLYECPCLGGAFEMSAMTGFCPACGCERVRGTSLVHPPRCRHDEEGEICMRELEGFPRECSVDGRHDPRGASHDDYYARAEARAQEALQQVLHERACDAAAVAPGRGRGGRAGVIAGGGAGSASSARGAAGNTGGPGARSVGGSRNGGGGGGPLEEFHDESASSARGAVDDWEAEARSERAGGASSSARASWMRESIGGGRDAGTQRSVSRGGGGGSSVNDSGGGGGGSTMFDTAPAWRGGGSSAKRRRSPAEGASDSRAGMAGIASHLHAALDAVTNIPQRNAAAATAATHAASAAFQHWRDLKDSGAPEEFIAEAFDNYRTLHRAAMAPSPALPPPPPRAPARRQVGSASSPDASLRVRAAPASPRGEGASPAASLAPALVARTRPPPAAPAAAAGGGALASNPFTSKHAGRAPASGAPAGAAASGASPAASSRAGGAAARTPAAASARQLALQTPARPPTAPSGTMTRLGLRSFMPSVRAMEAGMLPLRPLPEEASGESVSLSF